MAFAAWTQSKAIVRSNVLARVQNITLTFNDVQTHTAFLVTYPTRPISIASVWRQAFLRNRNRVPCVSLHFFGFWLYDYAVDEKEAEGPGDLKSFWLHDQAKRNKGLQRMWFVLKFLGGFVAWTLPRKLSSTKGSSSIMMRPIEQSALNLHENICKPCLLYRSYVAQFREIGNFFRRSVVWTCLAVTVFLRKMGEHVPE